MPAGDRSSYGVTSAEPERTCGSDGKGTGECPSLARRKGWRRHPPDLLRCFTGETARAVRGETGPADASGRQHAGRNRRDTAGR